MSWWCLSRPMTAMLHTCPPAAWRCRARVVAAAEARQLIRHAVPQSALRARRTRLLLAGCALLPRGTLPPLGLSWCRWSGHTRHKQQSEIACLRDGRALRCSPAATQGLESLDTVQKRLRQKSFIRVTQRQNICCIVSVN